MFWIFALRTTNSTSNHFAASSIIRVWTYKKLPRAILYLPDSNTYILGEYKMRRFYTSWLFGLMVIFSPSVRSSGKKYWATVQFLCIRPSGFDLMDPLIWKPSLRLLKEQKIVYARPLNWNHGFINHYLTGNLLWSCCLLWGPFCRAARPNFLRQGRNLRSKNLFRSTESLRLQHRQRCKGCTSPLCPCPLLSTCFESEIQ